MSCYNDDKSVEQIVFQCVRNVVFALIIGACLVYLTSCASQEEIVALTANSAAIAESQKQAAVAQKNTLTSTVDCTKGCGNAIITTTYLDARDRQKVTGVNIKGSNDVLISVAPSVVNAVGWIAGSIAATKIISDITDNVGSGNTNNSSITSVIGDDNSDIGKSTATDSNTYSNQASQANNNIAEANNNRGDSNDSNQANPSNDQANITNTDSNDQANITNTDSNDQANITNTDSNDQANPITNTTDNQNQNNPITTTTQETPINE